MSQVHEFEVRTVLPPVVEIGANRATYVRFQYGVKVARTVVQSEWPLLALDLDERGELIGIESVGMEEITIHALVEAARVKAPSSQLRNARYQFCEPADRMAMT